MEDPVLRMEDHEEGKDARVAFDSEELTVSELANAGDFVPGDWSRGHSQCSPPAGGPDAESIKFLDGYDDEGVVEDLEMEEDLEEDQEDEIMSREELEHAGEVLLPMLLNKMTPGGEGVVNKSTANLGTGSLFGRPTPAQLLLAGSKNRPDSDSSDDDDMCAWGGMGGVGLYGKRKKDEPRGEDIHLGSVCFYDRASTTRSASFPLVTCTPSLAPFVQVESEERISFGQWLLMARTQRELAQDDGRVVPGAASSSLL
mmetsp:Transcript_52406/g.122983  ORF Transcript_52406/g.122983 Transcript_52406/m.122983 type:complete len:257 (+) Transcript_52406:211-981(+)